MVCVLVGACELFRLARHFLSIGDYGHDGIPTRGVYVDLILVLDDQNPGYRAMVVSR